MDVRYLEASSCRSHPSQLRARGQERGIVRRAQPEESTCDVYWINSGKEERVRTTLKLRPPLTDFVEWTR